MLRALALLAVLCATAAPVPRAPVEAGDDEQKKPSRSARGVVASLDETSLVLRADEGDVTFTLDAKTDKPDDVKSGDPVEVWYHDGDQGDDRIATRVVKLEPPSGPSGGGTS